MTTARKRRPTAAERRAAEQAAEAEALHAALRWTDPVAPDVPKPESGSRYRGEISTGFIVVGVGEYARAEPAWSDASTHSWGSHKYTGSASQGGRALYSSRLLALKAARHEQEQAAARRLRAIDKQIAEEERARKDAGR